MGIDKTFTGKSKLPPVFCHVQA